MSTWYLDLEGGNDSNTGASFAQRVRTWNKACLLAAFGDTVRVMASLGAVAMSKTFAWVNGDWKGTLSGAVNANISRCESAWTASSNVTTTTSTTCKEGTKSTSIEPGTSFTTGLAAYEAMSSTDFSAYQQISGWIMQTGGTLVAASDLSIKLCSDNAGATPVDTLNLPAIPALNVWVPFVANKGSALGSAIQSVALYVNTDSGDQTFLLDNIVSVKASGNQDELHHKMLLGKSTSVGIGGGDTQTWMPIRAINGTTVYFDSSFAASPSPGLGSGTVVRTPNSAETVTAYSFAPSYPTSQPTSAENLCTWFGSPGSVITISGGWDRVAMSSQTGYTIFAVPNGSALSVSWIGNYLTMEKVGFSIRSSFGINFNATNHFTCADLYAAAINITIRGEGNAVTLFLVGDNSGSAIGGLSTYSVLTSTLYSAAITVDQGATCTLLSGSEIGTTAIFGSGKVIKANGTVIGGFEADISAGSAPTVSQIATAVWQDTTAGDFTVASSIGKSLYTSGAVPGAAGGLQIAGSNAATTFATLTVSGATTLTGAVTASNASNNIVGIDVAKISGTAQTAKDLGAINVTNLNTLSGHDPGATLASTTNITAGTITTTTNLTNLPTMPTDWLTSTGLAASAVTEIQSGLATSSSLANVQSDTDDIQTRLPAALTSDGLMKADTLRIGGTLQTARDIGASVLLSSGTGTGQLSLSSGLVRLSATGVDDIWDEVQSGHATSGTFGKYLDAQVSLIDASTPPSAATIAAAVWDLDATAHQTQGTFGQAIGDPGSDTDSIWALANTNLDAAVSSRSTLTATQVWAAATRTLSALGFTLGSSDLGTDCITSTQISSSAVTEIQSGLSTLTAAGVRSAVGLASANLDTQLDALPTAAENAAALLDLTDGIETNVTPRQAIRAIAAKSAGNVSGAGTGTEVCKAVGNSGTTRLTATVDSSGNVTWSLSL